MSDPPAVDPPVRGSWLKVAALMGRKPEMAVFKKFRTLNVLRLLEMQSDLTQQQEQYEYICSLDARLDCPITRSYTTNWEILHESKGEGGTRQRDAWMKLKQGLESYSTHHCPYMTSKNTPLTS